MKKIERKSRVLQLHREIVVHLTHERLQQAVGASKSNCWGCQGGGTTGGTLHETDEGQDKSQV